MATYTNAKQHRWSMQGQVMRSAWNSWCYHVALYTQVADGVLLLTAAATATQILQGVGSLETLQGAASIVRDLSDALSNMLPWPLQQPVAVLGSDVAGLLGFQPQLDGIERLAVSPHPSVCWPMTCIEVACSSERILCCAMGAGHLVPLAPAAIPSPGRARLLPARAVQQAVPAEV